MAALLAAAPAAALESASPMPLMKTGAIDAVLLRRVYYNYAPAIIHDGALYHLYWCAGDNGDTIFHLQAPALAGPWRAASFWSRHDVALRPTGNAADFDGLHTCDPNVIVIGGRWYLYYSGAAKDGAATEIGVAAGADPLHFERLNRGKPIVVPADPNKAAAYGAGQPAVAYVAPWIYLSFTDSSGPGGEFQYALRSRDPTFAKNVEEMTATGWRPREGGKRTGEYSWLESNGLDLMYDRASGALIAATDRAEGKTTVIAIDPETMKPLAEGDLPLAWHEGPSLVTEADKTSAPRPACDQLPVAVAAATGASDNPITWTGLDYSEGVFSMAFVCGRLTPRR